MVVVRVKLLEVGIQFHLGGNLPKVIKLEKRIKNLMITLLRGENKWPVH
jgi:hypothetical protein